MIQRIDKFHAQQLPAAVRSIKIIDAHGFINGLRDGKEIFSIIKNGRFRD